MRDEFKYLLEEQIALWAMICSLSSVPTMWFMSEGEPWAYGEIIASLYLITSTAVHFKQSSNYHLFEKPIRNLITRLLTPKAKVEEIVYIRQEESQNEPIKCPICQSDLDEESFIICDDCKTPHHAECWDYNTGCGVYGCTNGPQINNQRRRWSEQRKRRIIPL